MNGADVREVIVIGAGHNGLVTAAYLARAGLRPLVLEARAVVGGRTVTEELAPGFRGPGPLHGIGPLLPEIARDLGLAGHGLTWLPAPVRRFLPAGEGPAVTLYEDAARTAAGLRAGSARDAEAYPRFVDSLARIGRALRPLFTTAPPDLGAPGAAELWHGLKVGLKLRALGRRELDRLLRWGPMAVADLTGEWFEGRALQAVVAARGIHARLAGPRSAGTSVALLQQAALDGQPTAPAAEPRGGPGALTTALAEAARAAGAEIRTGAQVARILVRGGAATGVALASGEEIPARTVVSDADPRRTLLGLVDPGELGPDFAGKLRNYRCRGAVAKVNLALSRMPRWRGLPGEGGDEALRGRIQIGASLDHLERAYDAAKYGALSEHPYLDVTIPTLSDSTLAPPGAHVLSIHLQFAPFDLRGGGWASERQTLVRRAVSALGDLAPDLADVVVGQQVWTPEDLERELGLTGGHLLHGETALDQLFAFRPLLGWARYRTPIAGLYLCGSGTHPGGLPSGASGANASREILRDLRQRPRPRGEV